MKKEAGKSAMSKGKGHKPKHNVRGMHIKRGAEGGYIATHEIQPDPSEAAAMGGGDAQPPPQYPIADQQSLHDHIDEHMPEQSAETQDGAAGGGSVGM